MTTNEVFGEIHDHIIAKVKAQCAVDGNKQKAVAIASDIIAYANTISDSFADDGHISEEEEAKIDGAFRVILEKNVPQTSGIGVSIAWSGLLWWKGIKHYLNKWFNLGL